VELEVHAPVVMKRPIFGDMTPCSLLKVNYVSEEHVASNFRVEGYDKHETRMKKVASSL
jgi:hypothetical protein